MERPEQERFQRRRPLPPQRVSPAKLPLVTRAEEVKEKKKTLQDVAEAPASEQGEAGSSTQADTSTSHSGHGATGGVSPRLATAKPVSEQR